MGNNITCSINRNYRIAVTLHTVGTWFVSGIYELVTVNALHKGDYDDRMMMMMMMMIIIIII